MYRRSVRCRYCGSAGHTYVTCSSLKEHVSKNPNSYWAHKLEVRAESNKNRRCSWCQNTGHNKKTCSVLMNDKITVASKNIDFRKAFIDNVIKKNGIGIGALLCIKNTSGYVGKEWSYDLRDEMALVTDIDLDRVIALDGYYISPIKVEYLRVNDCSAQKKAVAFIDIPNWYVLGKDQPLHSRWNTKINFSVAAPGWYQVEDADKWCREVSAVERIIEKYENHMRLQHALENRL